MELTIKEERLIKFALNERLDSNKKRIDYLESLGVNVESDELFKDYLEENEAIVKLLDRFWNE